MLESAIRKLGQQVENRAHFGLRLVRAILTKDPSDDLHESVRNVRVFLQDLQVDLDSALSKFLTLLGPLVLTDRPNELIGQFLCNLVSANFKKLVHVPYIPVLVLCEGVTKD